MTIQSSKYEYKDQGMKTATGKAKQDKSLDYAGKNERTGVEKSGSSEKWEVFRDKTDVFTRIT